SIFMVRWVFCIFFFFQAEDGIRDFHVTGVQTCALPISTPRAARARPRSSASARRPSTSRSARAACPCRPTPRRPRRSPRSSARRSEERRVGKEGRARGTAYYEKKKKIEKTAKVQQANDS